MRNFLPLALGIAGTLVLLSLGVWQVQRLIWKAGVVDQIDLRIADAPVALPALVSEAADEYRAVVVTGRYAAQSVDVLISFKRQGPGFRVITPFTTDTGRSILVDRGFVPEKQKSAPRGTGEVVITGNLLWPDEVDGFTPAPDMERNIWFARDLPAMAGALGTEPVLIVVREISAPDAPMTAIPVDSARISNDHLNYAITWFSLAAIWVAMTGYFLWRQRRPTA